MRRAMCLLNHVTSQSNHHTSHNHSQHSTTQHTYFLDDARSEINNFSRHWCVKRRGLAVLCIVPWEWMSWHYYTRSCPVYSVCCSSTTHVVSKPGLVPREQQERNTARYRTEHSKRYGHWGLNFHLIGLSFKYLTQDNYHKEKNYLFWC